MNAVHCSHGGGCQHHQYDDVTEAYNKRQGQNASKKNHFSNKWFLEQRMEKGVTSPDSIDSSTRQLP